MRTSTCISMLLAVSPIVFVVPANATHLLSGAISYRVPDPINAPTAVEFDFVVGQQNGGFAPSQPLNFGDGSSVLPSQPTVISQGFAAQATTEVLRYRIMHTYPGAGPFTVSYSDCCRKSTLVNAPDDKIEMRAQVDLSAGNSGNALSFTPPYFNIQTGGVRSVFVPAADRDNTPISCRFATKAESGITTNPPALLGTNIVPTLSASVNPPGCVLTWDTTGTQAAKQYEVGLMIESMNGGTLSSTPVQFVVETTLAPPPSCQPNAMYTADIGMPFSAIYHGTNNSGGSDLRFTSVGAFSTLIPAAGTIAPAPSPGMIQWFPQSNDVGLHLVVLNYADQLNMQGACSAFVNVAPCPAYGTACSVGVGACIAQGSIQCTGGVPACAASAGTPSVETCNGIDDDCDGTVDNGCGSSSSASSSSASSGSGSGSGNGSGGAGGSGGGGAGGSGSGNGGAGGNGSGGASGNGGGSGSGSGGASGSSSGSGGASGSSSGSGGAGGSGTGGAGGAGGNVVVGGGNTPSACAMNAGTRETGPAAFAWLALAAVVSARRRRANSTR